MSLLAELHAAHKDRLLRLRAVLPPKPKIESSPPKFDRDWMRVATRPARKPTFDFICQTVCAFYKINYPAIFGQTRDQKTVLARQVAMYVSIKLMGVSTVWLGRRFGGRDHSTVIHARQKIEAMRKTNEQHDRDITYLIGVLQYQV